MSYVFENAPPIKTLIKMCLHNIVCNLFLHLTTQKYFGFDDLISKVSALEKRLLDDKPEKRGKMVVNKIESAMVGAKKSPTKLKVRHTIETTKPTEQKAPLRRPSMKEQQEKAYTFHPDDLESLFKQIIESKDIILSKLKDR